jgi:hypothetical protein
MVGMFDAGLQAASTSGNYDKARALANANLEAVKAMEYSDVNALTSCPRSGEAGFTCTLTKTHVYTDSTGRFRASDATDPKNMLRIKVTVGWGGGNTYSTIGLAAR